MYAVCTVRKMIFPIMKIILYEFICRWVRQGYNTLWIKKIVLLDHRSIQGYLNVGVEEQKRNPKEGFKTTKGCDILKL